MVVLCEGEELSRQRGGAFYTGPPHRCMACEAEKHRKPRHSISQERSIEVNQASKLSLQASTSGIALVSVERSFPVAQSMHFLDCAI